MLSGSCCFGLLQELTRPNDTRRSEAEKAAAMAKPPEGNDDHCTACSRTRTRRKGVVVILTGLLPEVTVTVLLRRPAEEEATRVVRAIILCRRWHVIVKEGRGGRGKGSLSCPVLSCLV